MTTGSIDDETAPSLAPAVFHRGWRRIDHHSVINALFLSCVAAPKLVILVANLADQPVLIVIDLLDHCAIHGEERRTVHPLAAGASHSDYDVDPHRVLRQ